MTSTPGSNKTFTLSINSLTCQQTTSTVESNDDVFLVIQADAGPPLRYPAAGVFQMAPTGNGKTGRDGIYESMPMPETGSYTIGFDYGVVVTGFDRDSTIDKNFNAPDFLFNFSVNLDYPHDMTQQTMKCLKNQGLNFSEYTVTFTVS